ncbi:AAEL008150-PA [Aedes aegypti]|uniref:AAEL008150-PA n=1 Tax=Aedes aegypti TaxID=7159 RepID=Q16ZL9_AEDAE|nr:AAEL008150-PA [Aedes aegypti]
MRKIPKHFTWGLLHVFIHMIIKLVRIATKSEWCSRESGSFAHNSYMLCPMPSACGWIKIKYSFQMNRFQTWYSRHHQVNPRGDTNSSTRSAQP